MNLWPFGKQPSLATPWVMTAEGTRLLSDLPSISSDTQLESPRLIVPRQYLFYLYVNLESVPHALRRNLIQQRLQQASPFSNPASWIVQEGVSAQIWFWDENLIQTRREQILELPASVLPESLLRSPFAQGFRLQPCLSGWEMQYWDAANLRHTRWLSQRPDARAQADFVRTCGFSLEQVEWAEANASLLPRPWNEKPFWSKENLTSEPVATKLIAGVLLAWLTLELGMVLGTQIKESYLSSSVAAQNEAMMDLVSQRDGALRQKEFNKAIDELTAAPTPLFVAAQVHHCLKSFDFIILDWQYQRGQLVVILQKEGLDTRGLIESCAANPAFTDVRVEPGLTPDQTRVLFSLPGAVVEGEPNA
jgi:hypothetical protein